MHWSRNISDVLHCTQHPAEQTEAHSPSNVEVLSHRSSLVNLILSLSSFKSHLKLFWSACYPLHQNPFPPLRKVYPIRCQQTSCCVDHPMIEKTKILLETGLEPCVDYTSLPIHLSIVCLLLLERWRRTLPFHLFPQFSALRPWSPLSLSLDFFFAISSLQTWKTNDVV